MQTPISDPQGVEKTGSDVWETQGGSLPATWKTPSLLRCEATSISTWNAGQSHIYHSWHGKPSQTKKKVKHLFYLCLVHRSPYTWFSGVNYNVLYSFWFYSLFFKLKIFNWSTADLQYHVSPRYTAQWFSYTKYSYILSQILFLYR